MTVWLSTTAIFRHFRRSIWVATSSETLERDKTSTITQRYVPPCLPAIHCKMNLEWLYFTSKSVFDQQGFRALSLALAMLSCMESYQTCVC